MPRSGNGHHQAQAVATGDHLFISDRAAGLHDSGNSVCGGGFDAVGEGKEGVRCHDRAAGPVARLMTGEHDRIHTAHLTGANTDSGPVLYVNDSVALDMAADAPGEGHSVCGGGFDAVGEGKEGVRCHDRAEALSPAL